MVLDLAGVRYPMPYLQIFSGRVIIGTLLVGSDWVQNRTVGGYLRDMVQTLSGVGSDNPPLGQARPDQLSAREIAPYLLTG